MHTFSPLVPSSALSIAVIIPALDEAATLPAVLADLDPIAGLRVIVVDNGSTDGTGEVARRAGVEVVREERRGYGTAVQAGLARLQPHPPSIVVVLDADHADDPRRIPDLTRPIERGDYDLVLADRTRTAEPGALTLAQRFGNALATQLIQRATGYRYRDMGPFRAIRWSSLCALGMEDPTWGWNVEMQMKAVQHGLRILELPLPYRRRRQGRSKISGSLRGSLRAGYRILRAVHRYR